MNRRTLTAMVLIAGLAWGGTYLERRPSNEAMGAPQSTEIAVLLESIIADQATAWNQGDLPGFMKAYWNDPKMTFSSGGKTERGWQPTLERYKKNYPDKKTMGILTFSALETTPLGSDAALMLGRWKLDRDEPIGGNFSLVWKKTEAGWRIIHDHSSADKQ